MIQIDHVGVSTRDAASSAAALAHLLGLPPPVPDGAEGDMFRLDLDGGASLLFSTTPEVEAAHIAFRTDRGRFAEVLARLRTSGRPFGNDPEHPDNGRTDDPLGGRGRVYFYDENGHLFEVTC